MKEVQPLEILDKTVCESKLQAHTGRNTKVRDSISRYVLAGLVSSGFGCGIDDVPGIYTDIAFRDSLCFIHAATKCKHEDKYQDFYWSPSCNKWIDELLTLLNAKESAGTLSSKEKVYLSNVKGLHESCKRP